MIKSNFAHLADAFIQVMEQDGSKLQCIRNLGVIGKYYICLSK